MPLLLSNHLSYFTRTDQKEHAEVGIFEFALDQLMQAHCLPCILQAIAVRLFSGCSVAVYIPPLD